MGIEYYLNPFKEKIACWKVYEMIQYSETKDKSNNLYIKYKDASAYLKNLGNLLGCNKIVHSTILSRNRSYFLIRPDGNAFIPILEGSEYKEMNVGNIRNADFQTILESWSKEIRLDNYENPDRMIRKRYMG